MSNRNELLEEILASIQSASPETTTGWAQYSDTQYTSASPFVVLEGERLKLPNNGLSTIKSQLPDGITDFYDVATQKITPGSSGDGYLLRINITAFTSSQNGIGKMSLDIGGSQGEILSYTVDFPRGTGLSNARELTRTSFFYSLDTFVENGGELYFEGVTGTTSIYNISYVPARVHKGR